MAPKSKAKPSKTSQPKPSAAAATPTPNAATTAPTPNQAASSTTSSENPLFVLLKIFAVLTPLSLIRYAYEVALEPLYGGVPTNYLLNKVLVAAIVLPAFLPPISTVTTLAVLGVVLSFAPNAIYWLGVYTSRYGDPFWGPAVVHGFVLAPIVFLSTLFVVTTAVKASATGSAHIDRFRAAAMSYFFMTLKSLWTQVPIIKDLSSTDIFLYTASAALFFSVAEIMATALASGEGSSAGVTRTKMMLPPALLSSWFFLMQFLRPPVGDLDVPYTSTTYPIRILSSVQSITGRIVVGEALPPDGYSPSLNISEDTHSMRYLRASHSLLGGVWTRDKVATIGKVQPIYDEAGDPLGDSIYSTFVLQEAARLINSTREDNTKEWKNALIIGLGAGISANGLSRHGITPTIVEIDPAVYEASRRFFGLHTIDPQNVYLEDARSWVAKKRGDSVAGKLMTRDKYELVVHDCFSGGGVPEHLFTLEFWQDLKTIVHPSGIVVINFAGKMGSDSSRSILFTLEKSFSQCRAFHDAFELMTEEKYQTEFINMVFFCTLSSNPITFREAIEKDFLNSYMRRHLLLSLPLREVDFDYVIGDVDQKGREKYVLTDAQNALGKLQDNEAFHHWKLMREVLPNVFWETY